MVLRFGQEVREVQPGLNYHLPYPVETVLTPKALRVNKIDIGMRVVDDIRRGTTTRDVPEESLMLTGDENIVDVDFSVLWKVKPTGVGEYLFNIQNPEGTVKAVAESAMREVIGRSEIQPILTGARQTIETAVQDLMQKTLDHYGAGILVQQVQLQKVDPPTQVIDAFRDVQAARADLERAQNEAQTYANRVVPEARGRVAQITQAAEAYKSQTVAEATGQTSRFLKIYDQYKKAPDVTRERMYLETMERVLGGTDKIILDFGAQGGSGVVPYLPLNELARPAPPARASDGRPAMRLNFIGGVIAVLDRRRADRRLLRRCSRSIRPSRRWWSGSASRCASSPSRACTSRCRSSTTSIYIDKRILDLEAPAQEVIASDQKRLVVDAFARYRIKDPLRFYQTLGSIQGANSQLAILLNSALRRVLGEATFTHVVRDQRAELMARIRELVDHEADGLRHRGGRRAHPARRSAGAEQPGGLSAHADRAPARGGGIPRARRPARAGNPLARRPRGDRAGRRSDLASPSRSAARATPNATRSSPTPSTRIRISSPSTARCRPTRPACKPTTRGCCSSRTPTSSAIFNDPSGKPRATRRRRPARAGRRRGKSTASAAGMTDFLAALGLVFVIEGLVFAAFPAQAKRAMASVLETPEASLRVIGIGSAVIGLIVVWLVRG